MDADQGSGTPIAPGAALGDRYRLDARIATGGMGQVWRGTDLLLDRPVAVKVLLSHLTDDASFRRRFREEAKATAALVHPNIATLYDYGEEPGAGGALVAYLVMELVAGEPLRALLDRKGRLPVAQTMSIVAQAASALQAAHDRGVVHRDVKPANVIVRDDGTVKLTDFGIARADWRGEPLTDAGITLGTALYLSPEQARGRPATPRSDIYSLGVVAFECLAGRPPFTGDTNAAIVEQQAAAPLPALPASVPAPVAALVTGMLAKDPFARPASAADVAVVAREHAAEADHVGATALLATAPPGLGATSVLATTPAVPPAAPLPPQPRRNANRRAALVVLVVALALVAAALAAAAALHSSSSGTVATPDVTDLQVAVAEADLANAGLHWRIVHVRSDQAVGTVVGQDPSARRVVLVGSTVTLSVVSAPTSTSTTASPTSTSSSSSSTTSTSSTSTTTTTTASTTTTTSSSSTTTSSSSSTTTSSSTTSTSSTSSTTSTSTSPTSSTTPTT